MVKNIGDLMFSVKGKIVDEHGNPLPYVVVMVNHYMAATNENGEFSVTVPQGSYNVMVRSPKYRPFSSRIYVDRNVDLGVITLHRVIF